MPRQDTVISLKDKHLELKFKVFHTTEDVDHEDGQRMRLVSLGPIAFFGKCKLTTNYILFWEMFDHGHFVEIMYVLWTSLEEKFANLVETKGIDVIDKRNWLKNKIKGFHHVWTFFKFISCYAGDQRVPLSDSYMNIWWKK